MKEKEVQQIGKKGRVDLRKNGRTKSQESITQVRLEDNYIYKQVPHILNIRENKKPFVYFHITKPNGKVEEVKIICNTSVSAAKTLICEQMKLESENVYFVSEDQDYQFDYRFHEDIGLVQDSKIMSVRVKNIHEHPSGKLNSYFIYDCISVGGFSKVFKVRNKNSGDFYVAKFVEKNAEDPSKFRELIYNEKYINELLDHPMLVKMHEFIEIEDFYIFILDYCPSGELFCLMKENRDMTEEEAKFFFIETVLGIEYMHNKSIIYRDIKPENILLDKNGHVKIADFGLAKIMREKSTSYCGSLEYMAPEIVLGTEHSFGVDHYCLGSLLYEMMVGCPPFYNPTFTPNQTKYHIVNSDVRFPSRKNYSNELIDFICKLLDKNPKTRLGSMGGIKEILSHPWVGRFDRQSYQNQKINPPIIRSLNRNNFDTSSLPFEEIKEIKEKILKEIAKEEEEDKKGMKKCYEREVKLNKEEKEIDSNEGKETYSKDEKGKGRFHDKNVGRVSFQERKRLRSHDIIENRRYVENPKSNGQNKISNNKSSIFGSNQPKDNTMSTKNVSRSLNYSPMDRKKDSLERLRDYSKSIKPEYNIRFSTSNMTFLKNLLSQNKGEKKKMRRSMESCESIKSINPIRKSQNFDKENHLKSLKFKFELKSKDLRRNEETTQSNTHLEKRPKEKERISEKIAEKYNEKERNIEKESLKNKGKFNKAFSKAVYSALVK